LTPICTKSFVDPIGGAYSAPQAVFRGPTSKGREETGKGEQGERTGRGRRGGKGRRGVRLLSQE